MEMDLSIELGFIKQTKLGKIRGFVELHFEDITSGVFLLNKKDAENILKLLTEKAG